RQAPAGLEAQDAAALVVPPVLTGVPLLGAADRADRGDQRRIDVAGFGEDPGDRPVQREQPPIAVEPTLAFVERPPQPFELPRRVAPRGDPFHSHAKPTFGQAHDPKARTPQAAARQVAHDADGMLSPSHFGERLTY